VQHKGRQTGKQVGGLKEAMAFYFSRAEYFALTFLCWPKSFPPFQNQKVKNTKTQKCEM
jgi:hypothetical protein